MSNKLCVAPRAFAWIALLLFAVLTPAVAFADEETSAQKGSIVISLEDFGTPMQNVEFRCYQVGNMGQGPQLEWELVPELNRANVNLNALGTAKDLRAAAQELQKAVEIQKLSGEEAITDTAGIVRWQDLPAGVYLLVQSSTAEYGRCEPFLVAIPYVDDSGEWSYQIEASAKGAPLESPTPSGEPNITPVPSSAPNAEPQQEVPQTSRSWLPQTGDPGQPGLWLELLCLAGVLLIVLAVAKHRRKR